MLKYVDRKHTDCSKWDALVDKFGEDDLLSMWVADMDFAEADCIKKALHDYVENVPFGYYETPMHYKEAFIDWEKKYHGYDIKPEWICYSPGIVAAFYWTMTMKTQPGDGVILLAPIYYPMMNAIKFNERKLVMCDMVRTGDTYMVDYEKFEKDIVDNDVKVFILSSPHNPSGKIFTKEELKSMLDICRKHNVFVISDEIHQDFEWNGHVHTPSALIGDYDDMMITMCAVSKTFNLAATQNSFIIIPDEKLREQYNTFARNINVTGGNSFGYIAVEAAIREGRPWFEECKAQIWENYCYVKETLEKETDIVVEDLQGTYLLWLDFSKYVKTQADIVEICQKKAKLAFDYGNWFGRGGDDYCQYARMNLATSAENVKKACAALIEAVK